MDARLLGPCGVYCGSCLVFRKGRCEGCHQMSQKAAARGKEFCDIWTCARERVVEACCDCAEFPCKRYEHEKDSIYSRSFLDYVKDVKRES